MIALDGRQVGSTHEERADVVVVGSGPAGATVAWRLAARGVRVVVVEEGHASRPEDRVGSGVRAMATLYRDLGTSIALGDNPMPYLQGRVVGGTSVINGAICWSFPEEVHAAWVAADPALGEALPFEVLRADEAEIERRLDVRPTEPAVAGAKADVMARGAEALGLAHRPIRRNVARCEGSGRCLQGCPTGAKLSMDRSLLPDAVRDGARILSGVRVTRILVERGRAVGVVGKASGGGRVRVRADRVVVAASAVQTPILLRDSGLRQGPVGDGLCGHPGVSVTGRFAEPVHNHRGATQGHEVTGLRHEGLKIETLGFDLSILGSRIPGAGEELARRLAEAEHYAVHGAAIRAEGRGSVRSGWTGPRVRMRLTPGDVRTARRGVRRMGEILLAAGALEVYPGVAGFDPVVSDPRRLAALDELPDDPKAIPMSVTHLFGTARMGSDPATSVVRPDLRHHHVEGLHVADSSVFPTNLGVNPQIPIMAVASRCAASLS
ncbi:MAG: GMC family oxidoreductase [Myxococcales bacterium]|nr:GMC family oxidoreductase [Myxococcales bacterium]